MLRDGRDRVPAQQDILNVRIDNGAETLRMTARFRDLRPDRRANFRMFVDPRPADDRAFIVFAMRAADGREVAQVQLSTDDEFGGTPIRCDGLRVRWDLARDRIRFAVPQDCMRPGGRVSRFKAVSGFWDGLHGDWTRFVTIRKG